MMLLMMLAVAGINSANAQGDSQDNEVRFYESFDNMNGKGGNDGNWNIDYSTSMWEFSTKGTINSGWTNKSSIIRTDIRPAYKCVVIGTTGNLVSPTISNLTDDVILTFLAGSTKNYNTKLKITIENGGVFAETGKNIMTIDLPNKEFGTFSFNLKNCSANTKIAFTNPEAFNALLLDEVKIVNNKKEENGPTTGINHVEGTSSKNNNKIYNLNGQEVNNPTKGLYIINGKKVILK